MKVSGSISFDRAAGYYDRTRDMTPELLARVMPLLMAELSGVDRCLEVGVGTGRIALPLIQAGVRVVGVDLSREMLVRMIDKPGGRPVAVAQADATRLPFQAAAFGAGIASHVLHLITDWRVAIDELTRVIRPGGKLLATRGQRTEGTWWHELFKRFFAAAGDPPWPPGVDRIEDLDTEMLTRGASVKELSVAPERRVYTANEAIELLEEGVYSSCWSLDDDTRRRAAVVTREWARHELGDLDAPRQIESALLWRAYRLP